MTAPNGSNDAEPKLPPCDAPQTPRRRWPRLLCLLVALATTNIMAQGQDADAALNAADTALTEFARTYEQRLTPEQVTLFGRAQDAWDAARRAYCAFAGSGVAEGSVYPTVVSSCLAAEAQARLEVLQELAQCEEGDLACPVFGDPK